LSCARTCHNAAHAAALHDKTELEAVAAPPRLAALLQSALQQLQHRVVWGCRRSQLKRRSAALLLRLGGGGRRGLRVARGAGGRRRRARRKRGCVGVGGVGGDAGCSIRVQAPCHGAIARMAPEGAVPIAAFRG
jgi:hypothetical protein